MDIYLKKKGKAKTVVAEVTFPPNFAIFDIYGCNFLVPFFKTTVFDFDLINLAVSKLWPESQMQPSHQSFLASRLLTDFSTILHLYILNNKHSGVENDQ